MAVIFSQIILHFPIARRRGYAASGIISNPGLRERESYRKGSASIAVRSLRKVSTAPSSSFESKLCRQFEASINSRSAARLFRSSAAGDIGHRAATEPAGLKASNAVPLGVSTPDRDEPMNAGSGLGSALCGRIATWSNPEAIGMTGASLRAFCLSAAA